MSLKPTMFLSSALVSVGMVANPIAALAADMSHIAPLMKPAVKLGGRSQAVIDALSCQPGVNVNRPVGVAGVNSGNNNSSLGNVYRPAGVNNNVNVFRPQSSNMGGNTGGGVNVQSNSGNHPGVNRPLNVQGGGD